MVDIKVAGMDACNCSTEDIPYFVVAYHNLFPHSDILVNDTPVAWFDKKNRFIIDSKGKMLVYSYVKKGSEIAYQSAVTYP